MLNDSGVLPRQGTMTSILRFCEHMVKHFILTNGDGYFIFSDWFLRRLYINAKLTRFFHHPAGECRNNYNCHDNFCVGAFRLTCFNIWKSLIEGTLKYFCLDPLWWLTRPECSTTCKMLNTSSWKKPNSGFLLITRVQIKPTLWKKFLPRILKLPMIFF